MRTVEWCDGQVRMIDQKRIPWEFVLVDLATYQDVAHAISDMTVRGAPAIGAAAAFGVVLAGQQSRASTLPQLRTDLEQAAQVLKAARPTAVNLRWAVDKVLHSAQDDTITTVHQARERLLATAQQIADDDIAANRKMGVYGAALIQDGDTVLHHCNTGALATVDYGTALGVIRAAWEQGKRFHVLLDETRPRMQGARLSAWELEHLGVSYDIIPDNAAGYYMQKGEVKLALVGADRIAANGDTANKIGTYQVAVLAKENQVPFYVVAPTSTVDPTLSDGAYIPIEERGKDEVLAPYGCEIAPMHFPVRNPSFDLTPHRYIKGIVTEFGIVQPPYLETLDAIIDKRQS